MRNTSRLLQTLGCLVVTLGLGAAFVAGCDFADDAGMDTDTDDGGLTGGIDDGSGRYVRCCYSAQNPSYDGAQGCVPKGSPYHACVDPSSETLDANQDGTVSQPEFKQFCDLKVPSDISMTHQWSMPLTDRETNGPLGVNGPWWTATSFGGDFDGNACSPDLDPTGEYPTYTPPTHGGTFTGTGGDASSVEVRLDSVAAKIPASGAFSLALSDCVTSRKLRVCELEIQSLSAEFEKAAMFGGYSIDTAVLSLQGAASAPVTFRCTPGTRCVGEFEFSAGKGTAFDMLLQWDQTNLRSGTLGGGSLLLGQNGLGNMSRVTGEIEIDRDGTGTLRLRGGGRDGFGGSFAEANFDLRGSFSVAE